MGGALGLTAQRKDSPRDIGVPTVLRRTGKKQGALGGLRTAREGGRRPRRDKDSGRRVRTPSETARWPTKSPQPLTRTRKTLHHPPRSCFRLLFLHPGHEKTPLGLGRQPLTGTGSGPRARRRKPVADPSAAGGGLEGRRCAAPCEPVPRPGGWPAQGPGAMKLYSLSVLYKGESKTVLLKAAYDVSSFSFFQRSSVQEFMTFTSQLIVERSAKGSRASVKEQEYLCHVYVRNDSLAGVVIADSEYPSRVAFTLLEKVLDEFSKQVDRIDWPTGSPDTIRYSGLDSQLSRYQNPREADPMTKVQAELDETKIILHNTMESLLERGEKLDDLVSKSEVLGIQSKAFYKTARKQNSCCAIM